MIMLKDIVGNYFSIGDRIIYAVDLYRNTPRLKIAEVLDISDSGLRIKLLAENSTRASTIDYATGRIVKL